MESNTINAAMVRAAFLTAAKAIEAQKEVINELNVFPVPDGDTGTNMTLTIMSAAKELAALTDPTMPEAAKAISSGSLRGARGNSGVILSQLLRGFTKVIAEYDEITTEILTEAFERAVETAYKAVMKPKEGTILTVARGGAEKARELAGTTDDMDSFFSQVIERMQEVLDYTPELLPVLKEAGVVDSGGQGLLVVMQGAYAALNGNTIPFDRVVQSDAPSGASAGVKARGAASEDISTADIKFGYCTEFIILLEKEFSEKDELEFKEFLESIGDSIVLVADDGVVKIHVHTNDPGAAFTRAIRFGQLSRAKIDNMREEHNERVIMGVNEMLSGDKEAGEKGGNENSSPASAATQSAPRKKDGFVAVSIGKGLNEIFTGLGVDRIIEGGQTMNPSTDDVLTAIEAVNAENVFVLPNNGNIILTAEQAKSLTKDKNVIVIPTKTVPQGITAMINYMPDQAAEDNGEAMTESLKTVKTGQLTYAVRDKSIDGFDIKQNDIMGLDDKTIEAVGNNISDVCFELATQMIDEDSSFVSVYYGENVEENDAAAIAERITSAFPGVEVEVHEGDQPIYYYIISVE